MPRAEVVVRLNPTAGAEFISLYIDKILFQDTGWAHSPREACQISAAGESAQRDLDVAIVEEQDAVIWENLVVKIFS